MVPIEASVKRTTLLWKIHRARELASRLPFWKALAYARSLKLQGCKEAWHAWCKSGARPANVPLNPATAYCRAGWQGFAHFLGTASGPHDCSVVTESRRLAQRKQRAVKHLEANGKESDRAPIGAERKRQGVGKSRLQYQPFKKALTYARSLSLTTQKEWQAWCKSGARPTNLPSNPDQVYKHDGWQGYEHWLENPLRLVLKLGGPSVPTKTPDHDSRCPL